MAFIRKRKRRRDGRASALTGSNGTQNLRELVGEGVGQIDRRALRRLTAFPISGRVLNATTGYPLAGVQVEALSVGEQLGTATTDVDGRFRIGFRDAEPVRGLARLLALGESNALLRVLGSQRRILLVSEPLSSSATFPVTLEVELPTKRVRSSVWQRIGARLEATRTARLHDIARELALPPAESIFGDLDLEVRHAALRELERAFLDPHGILSAHAAPPTLYSMRTRGSLQPYVATLRSQSRSSRVRAALTELGAKAQAFNDLFAVDWMTDPAEIKQGKIGNGVGKFQDAYVDAGLSAAAGAVAVAKPSDLSRYRDYLRTIFTGGTTSETYASNRKLLEERFKQNFTTMSIAPQPANAVLASIVKKILTAAPGQSYGFGISAATIEPKGERSAREYLDYLIDLSKVSARELGLRYRLDLTRPDSVLSNPVEENIHTLQRFLSDGFQDDSDPFPIVPEGLHGRAPFFLYYEEWLAQTRPFYAENVYQPRHTFSSGVEPEAEKEGNAEEWVSMLIALDHKLAEGYERLEQLQYTQARDALLEALSMAKEALVFAHDMDGSEDFTEAAVKTGLSVLSGLPMKNAADLVAFVGFYRVTATYELDTDYIDPYDKFIPWLKGARMTLWLGLVHLVARVIPTYLGDIALTSGDYQTALDWYRRGARFLVGRAEATSEARYPTSEFTLPEAVADSSAVQDWQEYYDYYGPYLAGEIFYKHGGLPYTADLGDPRDPEPNDFYQPFLGPARLVAQASHPMEKTFFRLRQGEVMLEWADSLYRTDEPSNIQRARELYKSVLWLHGSAPPIRPAWKATPSISFTVAAQNPALASQTTRARVGMAQIEAGLNCYGFTDAHVPTLRYRPLKDAADRFAGAAKGAQTDFLAFMGKVEEALREGLITTNMLRKAKLLGRIAQEQAAIAEFGVVLAQQQVNAVKAQIEAKKTEIEDHDDLFTQFTDFFGGMVDVVGGLPSGVTGKLGEGAAAGAGLTSAEAAGMSGAAAGGAAMGAYALLIYAGVTSLTNMAEAQDGRHAQLNALEDVALPLAEAAREAKKREVTIANLQHEIAQADAQLAEDLIRFQQTRFLNTHFWAELSVVMKRVLRRYLALGGRFGWRAERALAYEQDRQVNIVRLDYFPLKLQGVTGADMLQVDLAELEASRLDGIKQTVPIQHTYSIAFDFPLQFGRLKKAGRCTFMTREEPFRLAYPGIYGLRIRAVTAVARTYSGTGPVRGLLSNLGLSVVSRSTGEQHVALRGQDALPLSQFRLEDDMAVFGLPDEALLIFEGSGIETIWTLELPGLANANGLGNLADLELTFDLRASFSPELREQHLASLPTSTRRLVLVSAAKQEPTPIQALLDEEVSQVAILFDLPGLGLPVWESNRIVTNLIVFLAGGGKAAFTGAFGPLGGPMVTLPFDQGMALSNAEPLSDDESSVPAQPLNALVGSSVDQVFELTIDKAANQTADFSGVTDAVLGIEYTAELTNV